MKINLLPVVEDAPGEAEVERISKMIAGIDGMLASYIMLEPKEAWTYVTEDILDKSKDFALRYAALRTCRFLEFDRPIPALRSAC